MLLLSALVGLAHVCCLLADSPAPRTAPSKESCKPGDPALVVPCLQSVFETSKGHLKNGLPEYGVGSIDPIYLDVVEVVHGSHNMGIHSLLMDMRLLGLSGMSIHQMTYGPEEDTLHFEFRVPVLSLLGSYVVEARFLGLRLSGNGLLDGKFYSVSSYGVAKLSSGDQEVIQMESMEVSIDIQDAEINMLRKEGIHDPLFGQLMERYINDNWRDLVKEIRPRIILYMKQQFKDIMNVMLKTLRD